MITDSFCAWKPLVTRHPYAIKIGRMVRNAPKLGGLGALSLERPGVLNSDPQFCVDNCFLQSLFNI